MLDTRVWAWLEHEALDDKQLQARIEREQERGAAGRGPESLLARRLELETKLAANAAAEQQLLAEAIRGRFSQTAIDAELKRLAAEKQDLERQLAALGTLPALALLSDPVACDLRSYAAIIREGLTGMTPSEQRRAIEMLDTRLVVGIQTGNVVAEASCILRLEAARLLIDVRTQKRSPQASIFGSVPSMPPPAWRARLCLSWARTACARQSRAFDSLRTSEPS